MSDEVTLGSIYPIHVNPLPEGQEGSGSIHLGLTSLVAESNVPASPLGWHLALDRLSYSFNKDMSALKA